MGLPFVKIAITGNGQDDSEFESTIHERGHLTKFLSKTPSSPHLTYLFDATLRSNTGKRQVHKHIHIYLSPHHSCVEEIIVDMSQIFGLEDGINYFEQYAEQIIRCTESKEVNSKECELAIDTSSHSSANKEVESKCKLPTNTNVQNESETSIQSPSKKVNIGYHLQKQWLSTLKLKNELLDTSSTEFIQNIGAEKNNSVPAYKLAHKRGNESRTRANVGLAQYSNEEGTELLRVRESSCGFTQHLQSSRVHVNKPSAEFLVKNQPASHGKEYAELARVIESKCALKTEKRPPEFASVQDFEHFSENELKSRNKSPEDAGFVREGIKKFMGKSNRSSAIFTNSNNGSYATIDHDSQNPAENKVRPSSKEERKTLLVGDDDNPVGAPKNKSSHKDRKSKRRSLEESNKFPNETQGTVVRKRKSKDETKSLDSRERDFSKLTTSNKFLRIKPKVLGIEKNKDESRKELQDARCIRGTKFKLAGKASKSKNDSSSTIRENTVMSSEVSSKQEIQTTGRKVWANTCTQYSRNVQNALMHLTDQMSTTLRESLCNIDDICSRVRQCITEIDESDLSVHKYKKEASIREILSPGKMQSDTQAQPMTTDTELVPASPIVEETAAITEVSFEVADESNSDNVEFFEAETECNTELRQHLKQLQSEIAAYSSAVLGTPIHQPIEKPGKVEIKCQETRKQWSNIIVSAEIKRSCQISQLDIDASLYKREQQDIDVRVIRNPEQQVIELGQKGEDCVIKTSSQTEVCVEIEPQQSETGHKNASSSPGKFPLSRPSSADIADNIVTARHSKSHKLLKKLSATQVAKAPDAHFNPSYKISKVKALADIHSHLIQEIPPFRKDILKITAEELYVPDKNINKINKIRASAEQKSQNSRLCDDSHVVHRTESIPTKYADSLWFSSYRKKLKTEVASNTSADKIHKHDLKQMARMARKALPLVQNPNNTKSYSSDKKSRSVLVHTSKGIEADMRMKFSAYMRTRVHQTRNRALDCYDIVDEITLKDVQPIRSEYPRRDNVDVNVPIHARESYLYKLVYGDQNKFMGNLLEAQLPHLHCSTANCSKCQNSSSFPKPLDTGKEVKKLPSKKERPSSSKRNRSKKSKESVTSRKNLDSGKSSKAETAKKLKPYLVDPHLRYPTTITVMPVFITPHSQLHVTRSAQKAPQGGDFASDAKKSPRGKRTSPLQKKLGTKQNKTPTPNFAAFYERRNKEINTSRSTVTATERQALAHPKTPRSPVSKPRTATMVKPVTPKSDQMAKGRDFLRNIHTIAESNLIENDIQGVICNIEAKIVDILSDPRKQNPGAFCSVEQEIKDILGKMRNENIGQEIKRGNGTVVLDSVREQSTTGSDESAVVLLKKADYYIENPTKDVEQRSDAASSTRSKTTSDLSPKKTSGPMEIYRSSTSTRLDHELGTGTSITSSFTWESSAEEKFCVTSFCAPDHTQKFIEQVDATVARIEATASAIQAQVLPCADMQQDAAMDNDLLPKAPIDSATSSTSESKEISDDWLKKSEEVDDVIKTATNIIEDADMNTISATAGASEETEVPTKSAILMTEGKSSSVAAESVSSCSNESVIKSECENTEINPDSARSSAVEQDVKVPDAAKAFTATEKSIEVTSTHKETGTQIMLRAPRDVEIKPEAKEIATQIVCMPQVKRDQSPIRQVESDDFLTPFMQAIKQYRNENPVVSEPGACQNVLDFLDTLTSMSKGPRNKSDVYMIRKEHIAVKLMQMREYLPVFFYDSIHIEGTESHILADIFSETPKHIPIEDISTMRKASDAELHPKFKLALTEVNTCELVPPGGAAAFGYKSKMASIHDITAFSKLGHIPPVTTVPFGSEHEEAAVTRKSAVQQLPVPAAISVGFGNNIVDFSKYTEKSVHRGIDPAYILNSVYAFVFSVMFLGLTLNYSCQ